MHQPLAEVERARERLLQRRVRVRTDFDLGDGQLDRMLLEARQPRPLGCGEARAIDAQRLESLLRGPLRQLGVVALARDHQRGKQGDGFAPVLAQQAGGDRGRALWLDRQVAIRAILRAELHIEEPQKVIDLRERRYRALASATAGALFDGDGRWDAEDGIHVGSRRRLHELPCIRIQRFEVAPLAFVEQDVESEC